MKSWGSKVNVSSISGINEVVIFIFLLGHMSGFCNVGTSSAERLITLPLFEGIVVEYTEHLPRGSVLPHLV